MLSFVFGLPLSQCRLLPVFLLIYIALSAYDSVWNFQAQIEWQPTVQFVEMNDRHTSTPISCVSALSSQLINSENLDDRLIVFVRVPKSASTDMTFLFRTLSRAQQMRKLNKTSGASKYTAYDTDQFQSGISIYHPDVTPSFWHSNSDYTVKSTANALSLYCIFYRTISDFRVASEISSSFIITRTESSSWYSGLNSSIGLLVNGHIPYIDSRQLPTWTDADCNRLPYLHYHADDLLRLNHTFALNSDLYRGAPHTRALYLQIRTAWMKMLDRMHRSESTAAPDNFYSAQRLQLSQANLKRSATHWQSRLVASSLSATDSLSGLPCSHYLSHRLPETRPLNYPVPQPVYISFLRQPARRSASQYYYDRTMATDLEFRKQFTSKCNNTIEACLAGECGTPISKCYYPGYLITMFSATEWPICHFKSLEYIESQFPLARTGWRWLSNPAFLVEWMNVTEIVRQKFARINQRNTQRWQNLNSSQHSASARVPVRQLQLDEALAASTDWQRLKYFNDYLPVHNVSHVNRQDWQNEEHKLIRIFQRLVRRVDLKQLHSQNRIDDILQQLNSTQPLIESFQSAASHPAVGRFSSSSLSTDKGSSSSFSLSSIEAESILFHCLTTSRSNFLSGFDFVGTIESMNRSLVVLEATLPHAFHGLTSYPEVHAKRLKKEWVTPKYTVHEKTFERLNQLLFPENLLYVLVKYVLDLTQLS